MAIFRLNLVEKSWVYFWHDKCPWKLQHLGLQMTDFNSCSAQTYLSGSSVKSAIIIIWCHRSGPLSSTTRVFHVQVKHAVTSGSVDVRVSNGTLWNSGTTRHRILSGSRRRHGRLSAALSGSSYEAHLSYCCSWGTLCAQLNTIAYIKT